MPVKVGCYIIARDNAEEIITCLKAQEGLADSVMLAVDSRASEDTINKIEKYKI